MEKSLINITENLRRIRHTIGEEAARCGRDPSEIHLMAVTKTVPVERVNHAIREGIVLLGENRAQELSEKYDSYDKDGVEIHFIGHLQTNKVRQIVDRVTMIQSVDSLRLAGEISRQCVLRGTVMPILLEINVGGEASKSGVALELAPELAREIAQLPGISLRGLMSIPPICEKTAELEAYFSRMQELKVDMSAQNIDNISMDFLSMGMSDDYVHAIKYGANILRLGSAIFGSRV